MQLFDIIKYSMTGSGINRCQVLFREYHGDKLAWLDYHFISSW